MSIHEYAGFRYAMTKTPYGWAAAPLAGQHHAANRQKHCRAAVETFIETLPK